MDQIVHYIIVIPLILVIIYFQIKVFLQARNKIELFSSIFPSNKRAYSISKVNLVVNESKHEDEKDEDSGEIWREDDYDNDDYHITREIEVSQIDVPSSTPTLSNIKDALNMYLQKNRGAASDFALMKDVVERYCGAEEE